MYYLFGPPAYRTSSLEICIGDKLCSLPPFDTSRAGWWQWAKENEEEIRGKDLVDFGLPEDSDRPPLGCCRVLVEREFSKILPGLICDWTIEIRLQSAGLLKTLLEYCEAKCARPSPCFLLSCILRMLLFSSVRLFTRCSPRFGHPLTPPRPPTAAAPCCGS